MNEERICAVLDVVAPVVLALVAVAVCLLVVRGLW